MGPKVTNFGVRKLNSRPVNHLETAGNGRPHPAARAPELFDSVRVWPKSGHRRRSIGLGARAGARPGARTRVGGRSAEGGRSSPLPSPPGGAGRGRGWWWTRNVTRLVAARQEVAETVDHGMTDGTWSRVEPVNRLKNSGNSWWPPLNHLRKLRKLDPSPLKCLERKNLWTTTVEQNLYVLLRLP